MPASDRTRLFDRLATLVQDSDVAFAYAHGSSLTEPAFHDIDVAVHLSGATDGHQARALELAARLTRTLGIPVDVKPLNDAPVAFVFHALRGHLLFSRDDERLAAIIEDVVRRYLDVEPLVRHAAREAFAS